VLLQLRQNTGFMDGYWACGVAGHVEPGESVFDTAVREAREEVGVTLDPMLLNPVTTLHRTDGSGQEIEQRIDWFFSCDEWEGTPTIQEPAKCAGLEWFPLSALPELVPPHERIVLEGIAAGRPAAIMALGFGSSTLSFC